MALFDFMKKKEAPIGAVANQPMGIGAIKQPIGKKQVQEAYQTLLRYKQGKANLEQKIVDNEQLGVYERPKERCTTCISLAL